MSGRMVGVALAGGLSSRFGGEKAVARLAGRSLLEHALDRLEPACAATAVSARAGSEAEALARSLGRPVLHDRPGAPSGPLSGVAAALEWGCETGAVLTATLPCDLPLAPADLFETLRAALRPEDGGVVVRSPDGLQPLCAVLRTDLRAGLAAVLAQGRHPAVRAWLTASRVRELDFGDGAAFLNVNTREDLARAERLAAGKA